MVGWERFSRCRRVPESDWLNTSPPRPLWPRITQFAQSLLPARSLAHSLQGNACSERDDTSEMDPGSGISGDHTSLWSRGKEPRAKRGLGRPDNKEPLALSWKKTTEKDQVRAPQHPRATPQHTCMFRAEKPRAPSSRNMFQQCRQAEPKLFESFA